MSQVSVDHPDIIAGQAESACCGVCEAAGGCMNWRGCSRPAAATIRIKGTTWSLVTAPVTEIWNSFGLRMGPTQFPISTAFHWSATYISSTPPPVAPAMPAASQPVGDFFSLLLRGRLLHWPARLCNHLSRYFTPLSSLLHIKFCSFHYNPAEKPSRALDGPVRPS